MSVFSSAATQAPRGCLRSGPPRRRGRSRAAFGVLGWLAERPPAHLDARRERELRRGCAPRRRQLGDQAIRSSCSSPSAPTSSGTVCCSPGSSPRTTCSSTRSTGAGHPRGLRGARRGPRRARRLGSRRAGSPPRSCPGIFRLDDPCVQLRFALRAASRWRRSSPACPPRSFAADDALGWVYQFWQKEKKDEVNASERKIGGADLGPVTQLFTENYMVRFLLENSLGAWWASRHPDSPLIKDWRVPALRR